MWDGITESIGTIFKLFAFLGIIGFIYYLILVGVGLANLPQMVMGAIGIFIIYVSIFGGSTEIPDTFYIWNPASLIYSPILAVGSIILIWNVMD